ncbi:MAG: hypothetical protein V4665_03795 [Patescibacteria group bacterium]
MKETLVKSLKTQRATLLQKITLITETGESWKDVLISGEKIAAILPSNTANITRTEVVDGANRYLLSASLYFTMIANGKALRAVLEEIDETIGGKLSLIEIAKQSHAVAHDIEGRGTIDVGNYADLMIVNLKPDKDKGAKDGTRLPKITHFWILGKLLYKNGIFL